MSSLDFDQDAFYICTETSPRCFVVQKAIQMDRGQIERVMKLKEMEKESNGVEASLGGGFPSSDPVAPPAPPLPHWFNEQCRRELLAADAAAAGIGVGGFMYGDEMAYDMSLYSSSQLHLSPSASPSFLSLSPSPLPPHSLAAPPFFQPRTDIKALLRAQLEYYFSRENLATDRYLRCQMDSEQFVSISIIAGFRKIVQLTNDYGLIVQTLRESPNVEVDERGEKVRPLSKRCTILIRQLGEEDALGVREMLSGGPAYVSLRFGVPSSWYVTYDSEEATQRAYIHLQNLPSTPNNQPICARIKTGGPPADTIEVSCLLDGSDSLSTTAPTPTLPPPLLPTPGLENVVPIGPVPSPVFDLGRVLASLGYYPRATYRPGNTVVHVDECVPLRNPGRDKPRMPPPNLFNGDGRGGERRGGGAGRGRGGNARGAGRGAGGMRMMNGASGDGRQPTTEKRREGTLNGTGTYTRRPWNENGGMSGNANGTVNGNFSSGNRRGGPSSSFRDYHGNHHHAGDSSKQLLSLNNRNREPERGTEGGTSSEKKNCPSPIFAFEENSFPSLIDENPSSPPKEEKLSFSFVAAGKKREPVEPKKSYAQSLHVAE